MQRWQLRSLQAFNAVFCLLASCLIYYYAESSWHYGFFFTPFPLAFAILFGLYSCASLVSVVDFFRPFGWLGYGQKLPLNLFFARMAAVALPVMLLHYIGTGSYVVLHFPEADSDDAAKTLVAVEGFVWGPKRAEQLGLMLGDRAMSEERFMLAREFYSRVLASQRSHRLNRSSEQIARTVMKVASAYMCNNLYRAAQNEIEIELGQLGCDRLNHKHAEKDLAAIVRLECGIGEINCATADWRICSDYYDEIISYDAPRLFRKAPLDASSVLVPHSYLLKLMQGLDSRSIPNSLQHVYDVALDMAPAHHLYASSECPWAVVKRTDLARLYNLRYVSGQL